MKLNEVQFILISGKIRSINDNDIHYILAERLIELYNLPKHQCVCVDEEDISVSYEPDSNPWQIILRAESINYKRKLEYELSRWQEIYGD